MHGSTDILLDRALEGASSGGAKTEKIFLNNLSFKPCQECRGCDKTGSCVIKDDMRTVYDKVDGADAVILASPIFFTNITAQLKSMVDRFQCRWVAKNVLKKMTTPDPKKKGLFICVSAMDKDEFLQNALNTIRAFYNTIGIKDVRHIYCGGLETASDLSGRQDVMEKAYEEGRSLAKGN